ncbi:MAG: hypothetical protein M3536_05055, partial [Actinomycetota bacterium]|nr:hypothetical protein [Actinomycetota bacterium]
MSLTLGELSGVISLDSSQFDRGLASSQGKLADFGAKGKVVAAAAGVAIAAALTAGFVKALDFEKGNDKLAASLGLNEKESAKAGKAAGKLYAGAYGESMGEVNSAVESVMSSIKGMREASEEDVTAMTAKVLDMAAAFEIDAGRAAQVAGQMITTGLAKDGVEAADLLTASLQKVPKAVREDLLDAVDEYAPFFKDLGFTGGEAMTMLADASEKGMYGIDKTGDALKEFGIRATDMSKATDGAYESLGLNTLDMTNQLLAGGDTARGAFDKIITGLSDIEDPAAQSAAAIALFGTPLEDLSVTEIPKFIDSLLNSQEALGTVEGAADRMGTTLADNAGTKIESFKRGAEVAFVNVLGGQVLPVLENVAGFITATFGPALSGLYDLIVKGDYKGLLRDAFGWEEDSSAVGVILGVRDAALKVPAAFEEVIKKIWEFKEPIGAVVGLIVLVLIPHWVSLGIEALKSAAQQVTAWSMTRSSATKAAFVHSFAVMAMVGGWVLMGAQATINAVKIAAAWLVALGPVGWAIGVIAGLVAAFVWAYHNIGWFKDGVDAAMRWIGDVVGSVFRWIQDAIAAVIDWFTGTALPAWDSAIKAIGGFFSWLWTDIIKPVFDGIGAAITWVYESIIKPVFDGISAAVKFVGDVFNWLWTSVLKPVFDSASVIIGGFYLFFRGIGQLIASIVTYVLMPIFTFFWNRMVETFNAIGATINDWWNFAVGIFNGVITFVRDTLGAAFTWLYENVIKPVFDNIGAVIKWVWEEVIKKTIDTWVYIFENVLGPAFTRLYEDVIKPVFDAIGDAVKWVWENVIKKTIDTWVYFFQNILGPAFTWLYENVIKPVFDGIGSAIKWVWENVIKPVFDTLSDFITKTIPK